MSLQVSLKLKLTKQIKTIKIKYNTFKMLLDFCLCKKSEINEYIFYRLSMIRSSKRAQRVKLFVDKHITAQKFLFNIHFSFLSMSSRTFLYGISIPSFILLIWALLNSYSRIYLGVHYCGDILFGIIDGCLVGLGIYVLYRMIRKRYFGFNCYVSNKYTKGGYLKSDVHLLQAAFILTCIIINCFVYSSLCNYSILLVTTNLNF